MHSQVIGGIFDWLIPFCLAVFGVLFGGASWIEQRYFKSVKLEQMLTGLKLDVRLRSCPRPSCPVVATVPRGTEVAVYPERIPYDQSDGYRARWRKVIYERHSGWANEALLIEK
jgi:hypothetical protein